MLIKRYLRAIVCAYVMECALSFTAVTGQSVDALENLKNVMPPSPNSSAFAQYGNWPVSLYTGVPGISIPVTVLKGRTISVPISLSYHASGNHVGDIASWVGLGWSLNAGGVISRSVRGLPDESYYFTYSSQYANPNDLSSSVPESTDQTRLVAVAKNMADSEQDAYNFSAMGKSYRLLILADGTVKTIPHSNIKFLENPIVGTTGTTWIVLLENGTKLTFGGVNFMESTSNQGYKSAEGNGIAFVSSWQLQSITSVTGEVINFTYTASLIEQDSYFSESDFIKYSLLSGTAGCDMLEESAETKYTPSIQQVSSLSLASIESELERIEFISTPGRQDLYGGSVLSQVKVYSTISNQYIEDYNFNTSYTGAVYSEATLTGTLNTSYFSKRLRLNSVERRDVTNPALPKQKWSFDYNPQNLPSRRSFAQDHWGYFNGATTNTTLLPPVYFQLPALPGFEEYRTSTGFIPGNHNGGANREGNEIYMQAEMLTAIHYPTGGHSQFTFEANRVPATEETFTETPLTLAIQLTPTSGVNSEYQTGTFTITKPSYVSVLLSSDISPSVLQDFPDAHVRAAIYDANNNLMEIIGADGTYWFNMLNAGTYTFKIFTNAVSTSLAPGDYIHGEATLKYSMSNGVQTYSKLTGGLRIKSIIDYDNATSAGVNRKYYEYDSPMVINDINMEKDYETTQFSATKESGGPTCECMNTIRNSSTKYASGSIQGGTTGYRQVTTLYGTNAENGKTVSFFTSDPDDSLVTIPLFDPHDFPYPPKVSRDIRRGLLLSQKDYNAQHVLLKQIDNTYSFSPTGVVIGYKAGYKEIISDVLCSDPYRACGIFRVYYGIEAEQVKHLTSAQTIYDINGQNPMTTVTTQYYDNPLNTQPVRTETLDSKGDTVKVYSRTALEKTDINIATPLSSGASSAIDSMLSKNMVSQLIQQEKYKNDDMVSRQTTTYALWNSDQPLPQSVQTQFGTGAAFTNTTVNNYDLKGNLLSVTPIDGVDKRYVWDYKYSRPVAEVINAGNGGIAFASFESDGSGNWTLTNNSSPLNTTTAFTGHNSFNLTSNTIAALALTSGSYVVSLWAKSGASILVNGTSVTAGDTRLGWMLYRTTVTGTSVSITGTGIVDEVRLYPSGALMTTYTYSPFGVTTSTDANNVATYYHYDGFGRLADVRDDKFQILKTYRYHYKN
jgi:YD repeat-containing protein